MNNSMRNYIKVLAPDRTLWQSELEYTIKKGFMLKLMSKLAPGMFRKPTQKWMDQFKEWAEGLSEDEVRKVSAK